MANNIYDLTDFYKRHGLSDKDALEKALAQLSEEREDRERERQDRERERQDREREREFQLKKMEYEANKTGVSSCSF
jgi:hypothetical protein